MRELLTASSLGTLAMPHFADYGHETPVERKRGRLPTTPSSQQPKRLS